MRLCKYEMKSGQQHKDFAFHTTCASGTLVTDAGHISAQLHEKLCEPGNQAAQHLRGPKRRWGDEEVLPAEQRGAAGEALEAASV